MVTGLAIIVAIQIFWGEHVPDRGITFFYKLKEIHGEKQSSERLMLKQPNNYHSGNKVLFLFQINFFLLTIKAMIDRPHLLIS